MSLKAARPHRRPLKPSLHVWNPNDSIDMGGTYSGAPPPGYTSHANEVCPPSARSDDGTSGCHGINDDDGARGFAAAVTFSQSPHTTAESAVQVMLNNVHSSLVPASSSREADYYSIPTTSHTLQTDIRRRSTYSHVAPYRPTIGRRASASHRYHGDNSQNQFPSSSPPFSEYPALPNGVQPLQPGMDPRLFYSMSTGHLPEPPPPIVLHPPPQSRARTTNFVSLARKNTLKRTTFSLLRKPPNVSSITGDFNIDPALKVPLSLLKSWEPSQHDGSASSGRAPISSQGMKQRKNLSLEVENGGIDVDINLVSCTINKRGTRLSTFATLDNRPPSSLSMAYTTSGQLQSSSSLSRQPSTRTANLPAAAAAAVAAEELALSSQVPTLIDLRLKGSSERSLARSRVKTSRKAKEAFPLVARIHAPNPRPPFHFLASVVDIDSRCTSDQSTIHTPLTPNNTYNIRDYLKHSAEVEVDGHPPITHLPKSNISLHLPRTFHGPLTVHVLAGDIDQHVHLSSGISEAAALLSEDAFSRTYFIGDLDSEGLADSDFEMVSTPALEEDLYKETISVFSPWQDFQSGNASSSSPETRASSSTFGATTRTTSPGLDSPTSHIQANQCAVPKPTEQDNNNNTWRGDKIDVVVGRGHIRLQFADESEPFGRKLTFWKSIFRGAS
ncbi:hypothetical protein CPC08DRAFT_711947 [Agrocybe pediades]|nr:hypothetical protein CPC08DRAFT_711947 [Agrocybe pediades]